MDSKPDDGKKRKVSLIHKYFDKDLIVEITRATMMHDADNNAKSKIIKGLLTEAGIPYTSLGTGTNRMAVQIEGYAVKFALDSDGMIDSRREFLYTKDLQPYVIKVYECMPNGLIAVTEYVTPFTLDDFGIYEKQMREILEDVSTNFLIGDVGISRKNYGNWGIRNDGSNTICMLDFAYIYKVEFNIFTCNCDNTSLLHYDDNYNRLVCPTCGRVYTFGEIRKKVTKQKQEEEIGDIRRLGYRLTQPVEYVEPVEEFEPKVKSEKKKKKINPVKEKIKEFQRKEKEDKEYYDNFYNVELMSDENYNN